MRNARPEVARLGYEVYLTSTPRPTIDQVNATLDARGFEGVAERTYDHYRKSDRYGQERYIPINQFDVQTMKRLRPTN